MPDLLSLRTKRCLFTKLLAELILWVDAHPGWEFAFGEGYVALTDAADGDHDGPHRKGGAHYTGLGHDMILYIDGAWISSGEHPAWLAISEQWESMNELCRAGLRFGDANHFSLYHEGRS